METKIIIEMTDFRHKCVRCGKKADLERNIEHYCFRCHDQLWHSFKGELKFRFGKTICPESAMPFTALMAQDLHAIHNNTPLSL